MHTKPRVVMVFAAVPNIGTKPHGEIDRVPEADRQGEREGRRRPIATDELIKR